MDRSGYLGHVDPRTADAQVEKLLNEISHEKDPARQRVLRQGLAEVASPMKKTSGGGGGLAPSQASATPTPTYALAATLAAVAAAAFYYKFEAEKQGRQVAELRAQLSSGAFMGGDSNAGAVVLAMWPWMWPWQVLVGVSIFLFITAFVLATLLTQGGLRHGPVKVGRLSPVVEGDFVLLLIGIKPHNLLQFWKWLPLVRAMVHMGKELQEKRDSGFLGYEVYVGMQPLIIQYWRSFEHMRQCPAPQWVALTQKSHLEPDIGIWHETYLVRAAEYEGVYSNMPAFGLGKVAESTPGGRLVEAKGKFATAAGRLGLDHTTGDNRTGSDWVSGHTRVVENEPNFGLLPHQSTAEADTTGTGSVL